MLAFSRPGKSAAEAFIEWFNSAFHVACLNAHWFISLADARQKTEDQRRDDNEIRLFGFARPLSEISCDGNGAVSVIASGRRPRGNPRAAGAEKSMDCFVGSASSQ